MGVKTLLKFCFELPLRRKFCVARDSAEVIIINAVKLGRDKTRSGVEDKRNVRGVVRGMTKENANPGSVSPLVVGLGCLKFVIEDINRASKRMKVGQIGFDFGSAKFRDGGTNVLRTGSLR